MRVYLDVSEEISKDIEMNARIADSLMDCIETMYVTETLGFEDDIAIYVKCCEFAAHSHPDDFLEIYNAEHDFIKYIGNAFNLKLRKPVVFNEDAAIALEKVLFKY